MSQFDDFIKLKAEGVRSLAFGSISGSYADVGAATSNPIAIIMVKNNTDADMTVSWDDGTTDVFVLPAGTHDTLDVRTNGGKGGGYLPIGSQFQVKGTGATEGNLIVQCFYFGS